MAGNGHEHAVLKKGGDIADHGAGNGDLLVGFAMHEDEVVAVIIKEAALGFLEDHPLHRLRRAEPLVQLGAVTNVAKLDLGKAVSYTHLTLPTS